MDEELRPGNDVSIRDYVDILRRRKAIIIQTFVLVVLVGLIITFMTRPVYRSEARILVEGKVPVSRQSMTDGQLDLFPAPPGYDVETQIEMIQSDEVLAATYKKANIRNTKVRLEVKRIGETEAIEFRAESNSRESAEAFAKALPETYRAFVRTNRGKEIFKALKFATNRLKQERDALVTAELNLKKIRDRTRIIYVGKAKEAKFAELQAAEDAFHQADAAAASEQAKLTALLAERKRLPEFTKATTNQTNPELAIIRKEIDDLKTRRQAGLILFTANSPKIMEIDAQVVDLQARLAGAPRTIDLVTQVPNLAIPNSDQAIAQQRTVVQGAVTQREKSRERVARATGSIGTLGTFENEQASLEAAAEQHRLNLPGLLKTYDELELRQTFIRDSVQLLSPAGRAVQVAPRKFNNMLYAVMIGLLLGFCFAILQEYLDDRINVPDEARKLLQSPILGYVPLIENEDARLLASARGGSLLESYRVLRTNVRFAGVDSQTMSLLVSSTVPGEGKSVTAANLAVAMALDGLKVILVDCDLRRPTLHNKFEREQRPGVTNVLVGHTSLDEALKTTTVEGLMLLTAGPIPPNPAELLNSQAMRDLHVELRKRADVVLYDSPPFLATADAQILSSEVDGVLYVMQFGEARKSAVRHAADLIAQTHAKVMGVVFNKIDLSNRRDEYYYGYYNYYSYYNSTSSGEIESGQKRRRHREFEAISGGANGTSNGKGAHGLVAVGDGEEQGDKV